MQNDTNDEKQLKRHDTTSTLRDMDGAIKKYIEQEITPAYELNEKDSGKKVTVIIKNPERINKFGEYNLRDDLGEKFNYPIIAIERIGIDILGGTVPNWMDDEKINYLLNVENKKSFGNDSNKEYYMVRRPSFVQGNYSIDIYTDFMDDNNIITEQFILHENKYWKKDGHVMQAIYTSINQNYNRDDENNERTIISSLNLQLNGFILPKYINSYKKPINILQNSSGVKFRIKRVKL